MKEINEISAGEYLERHYGEIKIEIHHLSNQRNFAGVLQAIVNFLKYLAEKGQVNKIGIRMKVIGRLYSKGNDYLKYLIENLFIRSFEGLKRRCSKEEWNILFQQIPINLRRIYLKQSEEHLKNKWRLC